MTRRTLLLSIPPAIALTGQPLLYDVRRFGGLQNAIDAAARDGGGTVYVPAGRYVCGTIHLQSHVSVWLDNGATLAMSSDPAAFDPPEALNYDPHADRSTSFFHNGLFVGEQLDQVAIFGQGAIDGHRTRGGGPKPISLKRCRNVSIRGITIANAPNYNISLLGCDYVDIDGVTIRNGYSDGIDLDCSRFGRISNCCVESVDDAICLKASPALGERISTEHVTVSNCVLRTASIHFKCGTESYGDFRNIAVTNCAFVGGMGDRHGNPGVALYSVDGGTLDGVVVSNITMQNVGVPVALRLGARGRGQTKPQAGAVENVQLTNIVATGARRPSVICGLPGSPIRKVSIADMRVSLKASGAGPDSLAAVSEKPAEYPDPTMFGALPAYGLYMRHAREVELRGAVLEGPEDERRPGIVADDVERLRLDSVRASLWLNDVRDGSVVESGPEIRVSGPRTARVKTRA